jgi:drug/metabolite transporter (DMT)-like permease
MARPSLFTTVAPGLFVAIWSTGWVAGKFASLDSGPLTFLAVRFLGAFAVLATLALIIRAPWPREPRAIAHAMVSGVLLHTLYLGGVWWAIAHGVPAGLSAVIAALQPLMTATLSPLLGHERIGAKRMLGFVVGFLGIVVVVSPKVIGLSGAALGAVVLPLAVNVAAMLAVTLATFYQKSFVASGHLVTVAALQYVGAFALMVPATLFLESIRFTPSATGLLTLAWSVLGLSIGAIALLLHLIRRGEVSRSASLIYLVPPAAVLEAWAFFGETLSAIQIGGMVLAAIGVALANRRG